MRERIPEVYFVSVEMDHGNDPVFHTSIESVEYHTPNFIRRFEGVANIGKGALNRPMPRLHLAIGWRMLQSEINQHLA